MAFSLGEENDQGMTEMNLIPLIDIMLVLMIIFLVTATVANPSVPLSLPKTVAEVQEPPKEPLNIYINRNNQIFINDKPTSIELLTARFEEESRQQQKATILLHVEDSARYDSVAKVMALASTQGLSDISFVSKN
ncbi:ExbD/TolR family protein [Acinetobacter sp.]|uniref:ExbD/TolR family protein n=1 Tax=Acinetobacter sp. TaxID=472 RepID=UPI0035AFABD6